MTTPPATCCLQIEQVLVKKTSASVTKPGFPCWRCSLLCVAAAGAPLNNHSSRAQGLTLIAGSDAWRSILGCNLPPLLLVVLVGVVPLLLLPLQSPCKCPLLLRGSAAPAVPSSSMGETSPGIESGPSKVPWPGRLPLLCSTPVAVAAQNAAGGACGPPAAAA